jgi:hypothetical protein
MKPLKYGRMWMKKQRIKMGRITDFLNYKELKKKFINLDFLVADYFKSKRRRLSVY